MKVKKWTFPLIAAIILAITYLAFFGLKIPFGIYDFTIKGVPDMRYGIDIRGGVEAVFEPKDLGRKPTGDELESARSVIETRLDQQNILDREITTDKDNGYILVRFPWKSDEKDFNPQKAIAELGETAKLTFQDTEGNIILTGERVKKSYVGNNPETGQYVVYLEFDAEGTKLFDEGTARLVGKPMPIYMDTTEISHPTVQRRISGGQAYIDGMDGYAEAKALADKISAGALPFSMITKNHSTISPMLGSGALESMVNAGLVAFALICIFLIAYYRMPGIVASFALLLQVSAQLLALSLPQITLTLPGIAAVILSIGMGVDANIIISERISEEIKFGRPLDTAINTGFKAAFSSVFDGNITVMIVAVLLMVLGSGAMLSFAYSLLTGVILNFVAGVAGSRLMIKSMSLYQPLRKTFLFSKGRSIA